MSAWGTIVGGLFGGLSALAILRVVGALATRPRSREMDSPRCLQCWRVALDHGVGTWDCDTCGLDWAVRVTLRDLIAGPPPVGYEEESALARLAFEAGSRWKERKTA